MAIALLASACPAIQQPSGTLGILASMSAPNAPVAPSNASGNTDFVDQVLNPLATIADLTSRSGGANACAIIAGSNGGNELTLVIPGSGLLLGVKAGQALIGGMVENVSFPADGSVTVPDNTARVYIWLKQNKVLAATTSTTPPAGLCCFIGSCVTSGGVITSIDTSGVLYIQGSALRRFSADPGAPTDTPPSNLLIFHKTAFCDFLWNGSAYVQLSEPSVTADPTSFIQGLAWYRSDTLEKRVYSGTTVHLYPVGSGGGSGVPATTVSDVQATASVGTSTNFAREDHAHKGVHKIHGSADASGDIVFAGSGVAQSGNTFTFTGVAGTAATTVTDVGASSAVGTSTNYAREDHQHQGIPTVTGPVSTVHGPISIVGTAVSQSGTVFTINTGGGSGTVTSVDLAVPGIFAVSGNPVTTAGTLTLTLATQTANLVWAGPSSGGAAAPTFRSLVSADIPALDTSKITTGTMATARLGSGTANSSTFLRGDNTWATPSGGSSIPIHVLVIAPTSWTVPSTATEFGGTEIYRGKHDLTNATQAKLQLFNASGVSVPFNAPTMTAQFNDAGTWKALDNSTGPNLVFAAGDIDSGWITLTANAKADVLLRVIGQASSGTAACVFGTIRVQVK